MEFKFNRDVDISIHDCQDDEIAWEDMKKKLKELGLLCLENRSLV